MELSFNGKLVAQELRDYGINAMWVATADGTEAIVVNSVVGVDADTKAIRVFFLAEFDGDTGKEIGVAGRIINKMWNEFKNQPVVSRGK